MIPLSQLPLGVYEKAISNHLSWEAKLSLAKYSGFDFIEMSIDATPERESRLYRKETASQINRAIQQTGVPIHTMALTANRAYPLGSEDPSIRSKGLELVKRAIQLGNDIGIQVIHLAGYDEHGPRRNENTARLFQDSIAHCLCLAEHTEITLAIETMDTPFMGSCTNIVRLCRELSSFHLKCYGDIGNLTAIGLNPATELLNAGHFLAGMHLKDTRPGIFRDIPFGEGTVDFPLCFHALKQIGYQRTFVAEMWSYDQETFHPYLAKASRFLRGCMTEIETQGDRSRAVFNGR